MMRMNGMYSLPHLSSCMLLFSRSAMAISHAPSLPMLFPLRLAVVGRVTSCSGWSGAARRRNRGREYRMHSLQRCQRGVIACKALHLLFPRRHFALCHAERLLLAFGLLRAAPGSASWRRGAKCENVLSSLFSFSFPVQEGRQALEKGAAPGDSCLTRSRGCRARERSRRLTQRWEEERAFLLRFSTSPPFAVSPVAVSLAKHDTAKTRRVFWRAQLKKVCKEEKSQLHPR